MRRILAGPGTRFLAYTTSAQLNFLADSGSKPETASEEFVGKALPLVNTADQGIKVGARAAAGFIHMDQQTAFTLAWAPPQDLIAVNQSIVRVPA